MIVDASAVLAIVLREADRERYVDAIIAAAPARMSVANWLEATMVVDRKGTLCSIINSGNDPWPGSRAIAIAKAGITSTYTSGCQKIQKK